MGETAPVVTELQIGRTRDKSVGWYTPTLESLAPASRELLEAYSNISPERVLPHVLEIRDLAWEIHPYPCIGQFRFLDLTLYLTPSYPSILSRLADGASLLDLGCCCAQDLRKLVLDGAPAENLHGAELQNDYFEVGYKLFGDRNTFKGQFIQADVFDTSSGNPLEPLEGKMDIVQIGLFLHLFGRPGQVAVCTRLVSLLKAKKGSLVVGQQMGTTEPGEYVYGGQPKFKHDAKTFEELWKEVGEKTCTKWEVRAELDDGLGIKEGKRGWDDIKTKRLRFEVERLE